MSGKSEVLYGGSTEGGKCEICTVGTWRFGYVMFMPE